MAPLLTILDRIESQKIDLQADLESWSPESASRRPSPQEWSAIEVLDHLVKTEAEIFAAARQGFSKPHRIGITDTVRTRFIEAIFRSDRKVKVPPSATRVLPGPDLELAAIVSRWNDSRRELQVFLSATPEAKLNRGLFKHPVCGWMGMRQILRFFSVHMIHHNYQLARLRKNMST